MLLARQGHRVLVVDRATFPSDTVSTHVVHPPAVAALGRWGLLDRVVATGCPPIDTYAFDFGPMTIAGSPGTADAPVAYCPRRTVLDKILVDGAAEAGAEVREGFTVKEVLVEDGRVIGIRGHGKAGGEVTERADVVIGADGRFSSVAEAVTPEQYNEKPPILCGYYAYFSNLPMDGRFEVYARDRRGFGVAPTNDDLTLVVGGWPTEEYEANRHDVEGTWMRALDEAPEFGERVRAATRETRFSGTSVPNYFRKPYGPGWALVGDAGYNKDFITAMGISDAFRDAELLAGALQEAWSGSRPYDEAMGEYQRTRDEDSVAMFEFTTMLATLEPPPPEMQQILGAVAGNQEAMDQFARVNAATMSPAEFFAEENLGRIFAAAGER
jgi:2-polyprenyl-6-methoxyphenol hydroxylase-like FAD-dependent oxidoreductase